MSSVQDVRGYSFSSADKLFFDANIWLFIHGPLTHNRRKADIYSRAFIDIKQAGCELYIDSHILSEFINTYARWEQKQSKYNGDTFKAFRNTLDYKVVAKDIANTVTRILKHTKRCCSNFTNIDIESILDVFEKGDSDFNDQLFSEICKNNGFLLLTDDGDFHNEELNVLTANGQLLS